MRKVGEYFYERRGINWAVYVVESVVQSSITLPNNPSGVTMCSRKVEEHFDPEVARRRVYELNGWNNYKPLCSRTN